MKEMRDLDIRNVELSFNTQRTTRRDITFLKSHYDFIEGISITGNLDITALGKFVNLRRLLVQTAPAQVIDFDNFPLLQECRIEWSKKVKNIDRLKSLEILHVWKYKMDDLQGIGGLRSLRELSVIRSSITSLEGIGSLDALERLELGYLRKLNSLHGVERVSNLRRLDIDCCPHIEDLSPVQELKNLEQLGTYRCRKINSLKPLKYLTKLDIVYILGGTDIVDGDMTPLIGRKDATIATRKHYTHSSGEIDKLNGTVRPKQEWDW
ncbi:leucine-rich repeat domain-containing protein [Chryseolinea serpens]|uniref:leucine-rich repeat domain-containing protein n=1 Tax=Chryseolinea serpens TaxID=947013 RepID=UPI0011613DE0|nr:leucine-rich repeat domain-containing protein [Chryseolinea serpens]